MLLETDIESYFKKFDMNKFKKNDIYTNIWDYEEEKEEILECLRDSFKNLSEFYANGTKWLCSFGKHILIYFVIFE